MTPHLGLPDQHQYSFSWPPPQAPPDQHCPRAGGCHLDPKLHTFCSELTCKLATSRTPYGALHVSPTCIHAELGSKAHTAPCLGKLRPLHLQGYVSFLISMHRVLANQATWPGPFLESVICHRPWLLQAGPAESFQSSARNLIMSRTVQGFQGAL